jgi:hypothetical protein
VYRAPSKPRIECIANYDGGYLYAVILNDRRVWTGGWEGCRDFASICLRKSIRVRKAVPPLQRSAGHEFREVKQWGHHKKFSSNGTQGRV